MISMVKCPVDSGDCFTGEAYIKLSNGKYLKYHYDC